MAVTAASQPGFLHSFAFQKVTPCPPPHQAGLDPSKPLLLTSPFLGLHCLTHPSWSLTGHGVTQILPPLAQRGVPHHVDDAASQAAHDAAHRGEGAAGAGQGVPHVSMVEARGLWGQEARAAWELWGQGYGKGKATAY